jgi:hypothetical protein
MSQSTMSGIFSLAKNARCATYSLEIANYAMDAYMPAVSYIKSRAEQTTTVHFIAILIAR